MTQRDRIVGAATTLLRAAVADDQSPMAAPLQMAMAFLGPEKLVAMIAGAVPDDGPAIDRAIVGVVATLGQFHSDPAVLWVEAGAVLELAAGDRVDAAQDAAPDAA